MSRAGAVSLGLLLASVVVLGIAGPPLQGGAAGVTVPRSGASTEAPDPGPLPLQAFPSRPAASPAPRPAAVDFQARPPELQSSSPAQGERVMGEPQGIRVPAIGVDAPLVAVGLREDRSMDVPDFGLAGWYELGPKPGEAGPAVVAAHVDSRTGPDVFFRLRELEPGDLVHIDFDDGAVRAFEVRALEQAPKDELPVERIWNDTPEPVLRLITCGGEFDRSRRSYRENVIVYADAAD